MDQHSFSLDLIGRIYDAAIEPARWNAVAAGISQALAGAAVCIAMNLPDVPDGSLRFAAGIDADHAADCSNSFLDCVRRMPESRHVFARGFAFARPDPDHPIDSGAFHEGWGSARGLAAEWPIGHLFAIEFGQPIASIAAFRKAGSGPFSDGDLAFVNPLVPHLTRAFEMFRSHASVARQGLAMAEVMDRLPTGVILLNEEGSVVLTSRGALRILDRKDGLALVDDRLRAADEWADEELQRCISEALAPLSDARSGPGGIVPVPRPSGNGTYPISVARLLPGRSLRDAVVSVIVSDPDISAEPAVELLRGLYNLTPSEAEIVVQLARGLSLEEAARARGVSINTVRSHLKQIFLKTETHRQGELVKLALGYFVPRVGG